MPPLAGLPTVPLLEATAQSPFAGVPWLPPDNNLVAASDSPGAIAGTFTFTKGTQYLIKVPVRAACQVSSVWIINATAGSGTSTGTFMGLMSPAGSVITSSADCAAQFTGANAQQIPYGTVVSLDPASIPFVWVPILSNLAGSQPTIRQVGTQTSSIPNVALSAANYRAASNGTGLTSLTNVTPSSNTVSNLVWVGLAGP
jgi:hypothetical protein